jgi:hypothetical protein
MVMAVISPTPDSWISQGTMSAQGVQVSKAFT